MTHGVFANVSTLSVDLGHGSVKKMLRWPSVHMVKIGLEPHPADLNPVSAHYFMSPPAQAIPTGT